MSVKCIARERIRKAQEATDKIDKDLWGPIERLQRAGSCGNGAGIFSDVSLLRSALAEAAAAIKRAQDIMKETDWPTNVDYDTI